MKALKVYVFKKRLPVFARFLSEGKFATPYRQIRQIRKHNRRTTTAFGA